MKVKNLDIPQVYSVEVKRSKRIEKFKKNCKIVMQKLDFFS